MRTHVLNLLTRRAASQVTRRHSLLTLGGAALSATAIAQPERASARKKKGKDCGKKERQRCNADAETCRSLILAQCELDPAGCQALAACCDTCSADGLLRCALELQTTMAAAKLT